MRAYVSKSSNFLTLKFETPIDLTRPSSTSFSMACHVSYSPQKRTAVLATPKKRSPPSRHQYQLNTQHCNVDDTILSLLKTPNPHNLQCQLCIGTCARSRPQGLTLTSTRHAGHKRAAAHRSPETTSHPPPLCCSKHGPLASPHIAQCEDRSIVM
jgi:hypothetical protein